MKAPSIVEVANATANLTLDTMAGIAYLMAGVSAVKAGINVFESGAMASSGAGFSDVAASLSEGVGYATEVAFDLLAVRGIDRLRTYLNGGPATPPDLG